MSGHIFIIEPDVVLAQSIQLKLCREGYRVNFAQDGTAGLIAIRELNPDLVILGESISDISYLEICQRLRSTQQSTLLLVLTEHDSVRDRITALDAGANDCVSKPLILEEFTARVRAHLRRSQTQQSHLLMFADLALDRNTRQVYCQGREIELTAKEFDLLEYLMTYPRQVISRNQILEHVWSYDFAERSNVIEVYVRYLRLKLETTQARRLIHTVRGVGYVLRD